MDEYDLLAHGISDKTIETLQQTGWFPGRAIAIQPYSDALEQKGYTVFPSVRDFLSCFGGLEIQLTVHMQEKRNQR